MSPEPLVNIAQQSAMRCGVWEKVAVESWACGIVLSGKGTWDPFCPCCSGVKKKKLPLVAGRKKLVT